MTVKLRSRIFIILPYHCRGHGHGVMREVAVPGLLQTPEALALHTLQMSMLGGQCHLLILDSSGVITLAY